MKVPTAFYKVVVVVDDALDQLSDTAFRQSQVAVLPSPRELPRAFFDPGRFSLDQIALAELEEMTGLDFGRLKLFDGLAAHPLPKSAAPIGPVRIPLRNTHDAVLWAAQPHLVAASKF